MVRRGALLLAATLAATATVGACGPDGKTRQETIERFIPTGRTSLDLEFAFPAGGSFDTTFGLAKMPNHFASFSAMTSFGFSRSSHIKNASDKKTPTKTITGLRGSLANARTTKPQKTIPSKQTKPVASQETASRPPSRFPAMVFVPWSVL